MHEGRNQVDAWLKSLGQRDGLSLNLNDKQYCTINTNDFRDLSASIPADKHTLIIVRLSTDGKSVKLITFIGDEKYRDNSTTLEKILHLNYGSDALNGCTISLCPNSSRFVLQGALPIIALDEIGFINLIYNFALTHAEALKQIIAFGNLNPEQDKNTTPGALLTNQPHNSTWVRA